MGILGREGLLKKRKGFVVLAVQTLFPIHAAHIGFDGFMFSIVVAEANSVLDED